MPGYQHACRHRTSRTQDANSSLVQIGGGHWATFVPGLQDGDQYKFYIDGPGSSGYKRDPRARVLTFQPSFPIANCIMRDPSRFPWHQAHFTPPAFNDLIIYQLHVGTYDVPAGDSDGSFFDAIQRVPYLADLGVNAIELLPIQEFPTSFSMGYNGTDPYVRKTTSPSRTRPGCKLTWQRPTPYCNGVGKLRMRVSTCCVTATISFGR